MNSCMFFQLIKFSVRLKDLVYHVLSFLDVSTIFLESSSLFISKSRSFIFLFSLFSYFGTFLLYVVFQFIEFDESVQQWSFGFCVGVTHV